MRRIGVFSTVLSGVAVLALTAPALAGGTVHYSYPEQCFDYDDFLVCSSSSGQYSSTVTPSGNESYVGKGTSTYSITGPDYSYESDFSYRYHVLYKRGSAHEQSFKSSETFTINGQTCYYTDHFHFANGEVQFSRPELNCS